MFGKASIIQIVFESHSTVVKYLKDVIDVKPHKNDEKDILVNKAVILYYCDNLKK